MGSRGLEDKHVLDWDEDDVHHWLSELGYPQYGREIKGAPFRTVSGSASIHDYQGSRNSEVHNIRGDTLCMLDTDTLVSLGVKTVGQRLSILKSIYHLKVAHAIPLSRDDYIPPSLASDEQVSIEDIHTNVKEQANRIRALEENNGFLSLSIQSFSDEIAKLRSAIGLSSGTLKATQKRIPLLQNEGHPVERSTRSTEEDELTGDNQASSEHAATLQMLPMPFTVDGITYAKLSLDDPTWKVLPAALRKHNVPRGLWQNYAMFISYGPPSNRGKRLLDTDEKPLYLFKKLKEAGKNPAFVLKNLKEKGPHLSGLDSNNHPERKSSLTPQGITIQGQHSIYSSPPSLRSTPSPFIDPFQ